MKGRLGWSKRFPGSKRHVLRPMQRRFPLGDAGGGSLEGDVLLEAAGPDPAVPGRKRRRNQGPGSGPVRDEQPALVAVATAAARSLTSSFA